MKNLALSLCAALILASLPPAATAALVGKDGPKAGVPIVPQLGATALPVAPNAVPGVPAAPKAAASAAAAQPGVQAQLAAGVQAIGDAKTGDARGAAVNGLYEGKTRGSADAATVDASGVPAGAAGILAGDFDEPFVVVAVDSKKPLAERLSAVKELAKRGASAKNAVDRVAEANPEGGADDYEVHRAARRAQADLGDVKSLRPVSRAHADQILAKLNADKPQSVVSDYDDTLAPYAKPISAETAAALQGAADAGVDVTVLTDRKDTTKNPQQVTIVQSLEGMTLGQKLAVTVAADSGARILEYDAKGQPVLAFDLGYVFTPEQNAAILAASKKVEEKFGRFEFKGEAENLDTYKWVRFLDPKLPLEQVLEAAKLMQAELDRAGMDIAVIGKQAADPKNPSYLSIAGTRSRPLNKAVGMQALRDTRAERERFKDARRFPLLGKIADAVGLKPRQSAPVPGSAVLVLGDSFFGTRIVDADMVKAAPGSMAIAVGGLADPRIDNIFVWPGKKEEAAKSSAEVLGALAKPSSTAVNKKALFGLFLQRTIGIAAFLGVTIAYPFAAVPIVGWAGYGVLMAFSPLAGIAAGAVSGILIDKLSPRNGMLVNTVMRGVLLMALPAFWYFGVLNFGTLLVAAMAEGYLLSTIMATEGAAVRRIFPGKHQGWLNDTLLLNYFGLQVLLGLIVGMGQIVDKWNPFYVFMGASLINLVPVFLTILFTIPNDKPTSSAQPQKPLGERAAAFMKKYWKEAGVLAAAFGNFVAIKFFPAATTAWLAAHLPAVLVPSTAMLSLLSPLVVTAALVFWTARSEAGRNFWKGAFTNKMQDGTEAPERMRNASMLMGLSALLFYPLQLFILPHAAETLAGASGKGLLLGQFLGALFLGNMTATASRSKMPELRLPFIGRFGAEKLVRAAVIGLTGAWVVTSLAPGSLLAAAAAMAVSYGAMKLTEKITTRGWITFLGAGMSAVWLPYLVWAGFLPFLSVPTAIFLSLIAVGMSYGPAFASMITYLAMSAKPADSGKVFGIHGSYFNAAISFGYGLITLASGLLDPAFPALLAVVGVAYMVSGLIFRAAPSKLPGLPKELIQTKK